jgi:CRISPR-associated protein Cas5t
MMLYLYLEAPFAACRTFTAGWYRPTATFLTPSAAYGLLLNVAGIESRLREGEAGHDGKTPASYLRRGLPLCKIALGSPDNAFPRLQSLYQQLHNYPVGASGASRAEECHGSKYNITPVRREFLSQLRAVIALDAPELEKAVHRGLSGEGPPNRYGIPFLGDNSFLLDRLEAISGPRDRCTAVSWYEQIGGETTKARSRATRLTILIDRADLSKTQSALFAPTDPFPADAPPPPSAWVEIRPPQPEVPPPRSPRRSPRK